MGCIEKQAEEIFTKRIINGRNHRVAPNKLDYYRGIGSNYSIDYLDTNSVYRLKFHDMSDWIAESLSSGYVLDVGCGPGHLKYWMKSRHPKIEVVNADFSFEILKENNNHNKEGINLSADRLPFGEETFDGIVFGDVLEHLTPEQANLALLEAMRVLKYGGHIFINIPNKVTWSRKTFEEPTHIWIPTINDMKRAIDLMGFKKIRVSTRGYPFSKSLRTVIGRDLHLPVFGTSIFINAIK